MLGRREHKLKSVTALASSTLHSIYANMRRSSHHVSALNNQTWSNFLNLPSLLNKSVFSLSCLFPCAPYVFAPDFRIFLNSFGLGSMFRTDPELVSFCLINQKKNLYWAWHTVSRTNFHAHVLLPAYHRHLHSWQNINLVFTQLCQTRKTVHLYKWRNQSRWSNRLFLCAPHYNKQHQ